MLDCLCDFEKKIIRSGLERNTGKKRPNTFRCSSLPFCPVRHCMLELAHRDGVEEQESLSLDFFTHIGTQVHSILQKWSGFHGLIYGDWELKREKKLTISGKEYSRTTVKTVTGKIGPVICEDTGELYTYKELSVKCPETGLTGHVDCLIPYKDGFIVADFKTSSSEKMKTMACPPIGYHTQIHAYWYLLSKYGPYDEKKQKWRSPLNIKGSVIFFISRDNPFSEDGVKMFTSKILDTGLIEHNLKMYKLSRHALRKNEGFDRLVTKRLCMNREDVLAHGCDFSVIGCAISDKKVLKGILEQLDI